MKPGGLRMYQAKSMSLQTENRQPSDRILGPKIIVGSGLIVVAAYGLLLQRCGQRCVRRLRPALRLRQPAREGGLLALRGRRHLLEHAGLGLCTERYDLTRSPMCIIDLA